MEGTEVPHPCRLFILYMMYDEYSSPELTVVKVKVEKGFTGSNNEGGGIGLPGWEII